MGDTPRWDVFICHASQDKNSVARPLAARLAEAGLSVWLDENEISIGDSLRRSIEQGIQGCRFSVVILSPSFFSKDWAQRELSAFLALESGERKVLLPILHGIEVPEVTRRAPLLADRFALSTSEGLTHVARKLIEAVRRSPPPAPVEENTDSHPPDDFTSLESDRLLGTRIGTYLLRERIGAGGSGVVFRASSTTYEHDVAIKLFYPLEPVYAHLSPLFERGFRAVGALRHPNIVRAIEWGRTVIAKREVFFLVMELVPGINLMRWSRALPAQHAFALRLKCAIALTDALREAHQTAFVDPLGFEVRGVLHGDMKPANILVDASGAPYLHDFLFLDVRRLQEPPTSKGFKIVKPEEEPYAITGDMGTPGYMAPEQERHGLVTVATDLYGLGMTLTELFFPNRSYFSDLLSDDSLPPPLRRLLIKMIEPDPGHRPRSAKVVLARLRALSGASLT